MRWGEKLEAKLFDIAADICDEEDTCGRPLPIDIKAR